ncbi:MAG TPA: bacillithiol system redox-active protein YtxJ [Saprospiraceae bacterium]|mgnify:CR=1 FL=1|nr:bacillithiol system redox-active protein YtxJ [Saprospiraceae bacterium]HPK08987.1 bacillithiol system redox-active protein YtxJ [Saprospiraceae bacterium]HPQ21144.1 bacillithiol system redox-active protein YtxJ [Saprospiraceae bacterium]HRX29251.1 bacillithiol system redox-active protein YtxJ [Saprospiraceae bacterium]
MIDWIELIPPVDYNKLDVTSKEHPIFIFKHSTSCPLSKVALLRLEDAFESAPINKFYFLDLLRYRDESNHIAEKYHVHHESPQLIVIDHGECVLDLSHLDIEPSEILEYLRFS